MKCEKCNKEISEVLVNVFNHDGSDSEHRVPIRETEESAVLIDVDSNWTGYNLTEEEMRETILCPYCNQFPFIEKELQVYDIVRVVMFRQHREGNYNEANL